MGLEHGHLWGGEGLYFIYYTWIVEQWKVLAVLQVIALVTICMKERHFSGHSLMSSCIVKTSI